MSNELPSKMEQALLAKIQALEIRCQVAEENLREARKAVAFNEHVLDRTRKVLSAVVAKFPPAADAGPDDPVVTLHEADMQDLIAIHMLPGPKGEVDQVRIWPVRNEAERRAALVREETAVPPQDQPPEPSKIILPH